jgi:hypothetical protein
MPRSLYDLLPEEVRRAYPAESLDAPAAKVLLRPGVVPDDYDPERSAVAGAALAKLVPQMTGMRAMTNRVRAGQGGQLGPSGVGRNTEPTGDFGPEPTEPTAESGTQQLYRMMAGGLPAAVPGGRIPGPVYQGALRLVAGAVQAAPKIPGTPSTRDLVPPPENFGEHALDVAGGLAGFTATAGTLTALGLGPSLAAGGAAALQEGTLKQRAVRGLTTLAGAGFAGKTGALLAGPTPGIARTVASHLPGAAAFGAAVPWAEQQIAQLTGEKPAPFTGWDAAKGSLEMMVVNTLLGARGIVGARGAQRVAVRGALGQRRAAGVAQDAALAARRAGGAPEQPTAVAPEVQARAEVIAKAVAPPRGLTPQNVAASKRLGAHLNSVLAGKLVGIRLPGTDRVVAAKIEQVIAYSAEHGETVHLVVTDPAGSPVPVSFGSVDEMIQAIRPLPGSKASPERAVSREVVGAVRSVPDEARLAEVEGKLARLQTNAPPKGNRDHRRWAQRVENLTAERDALKAKGVKTSAPSPAPAARPQPTSAELPGVADASSALTPEVVSPQPPENKRDESVTPKPAAVEDRGAIGKEGVEHPPSEHFAVAQMLAHTGAAKVLAKAAREGGTLAETRTAIRTLWSEGGDGQHTFKRDKKGEPVMVYTERTTGKKVRVGLDRMAAVAHEGLGIKDPKPAAASRAEEAPPPAAPESPSPPPEPASAPESPKRADEEPPEDSRFARNDGVRVPNEFPIRKNDKRSRVGGIVTGHTTMRNPYTGEQEPAVVVSVRHGSGKIGKSGAKGIKGGFAGFSWTEHTFPERLVRKVPTLASREAAQKAKDARGVRIKESLEKRIGGDVEKAREVVAEYQEKADEIIGSIEGDMNHPDYASVRAKWKRAMEVVYRAKDILKKLEVKGDEESSDFLRPASARRARAVAAPPTAPPVRSRGLVITPPAGRALTEAEVANLPAAPVPGTPAQRLRGMAALKKLVGDAGAKGADKIREAGESIIAAVNANFLAPKRGLDEFYAAKGDRERRAWRVQRNQRHFQRMWDHFTPEQVLDFYDRFESGRAQATPDMQGVADQMGARYEAGYKAILRHKEGLNYIRNYFAHIWEQTPEKSASVLPKRPLGGTKDFLKKRYLPTIREGLAKGLKLRFDNPEVALQHWEDGVAKFLLLNELITEPRETDRSGAVVKEGGRLVQAGLVKRVGLGARPGDGKLPEGWKKFNQSWADIYLPPRVEVSEYSDPAITGALKGTLAAIGGTHKRKMNVGGGALGRSISSPGRAGEVLTKHFTPEQVLAHELGHALDSKFGLQDVFLRVRAGKGAGVRATIRKELKALAMLRVESATKAGSPVPKSFASYIRSAPEKMAVMTEAFVHAKERFQEVAPNTYDAYRRFLASHPETSALLKMKPSLEYEETPVDVPVHGIVKGGEYWGEPGIVRILDNYMSPDAIRSNVIGRTALATRNRMNALQLGLSAFHATNVAFISSFHDLSVGLNRISRGDLRGLKNVGRSVVPLASAAHAFKRGQAMFSDASGSSRLERDYFGGGGSLLRPEHEQSSFDKTIRYTVKKQYLRAGGHLPFAAIEAPTRAIMSAVERMKVGAFEELFAAEMERNADKLGRGEMTRAEIARKTNDEIDNRLGIMNYDNLGWNNLLKTSVMLLVRAPGWTIGTARALGGAALIDLPVQAARAAKLGLDAATGKPLGPRPEFTPRMQYALAFTMLHLGIGAAYQVLHTGKRPETLEDYINPRNGLLNPDGSEQRVVMPTDLRTVIAWVKAGSALVHGERNAGLQAWRAVATGPLPDAIGEFMNNQSYRGPLHRPIKSMDDWAPAAGETLKWMFGKMTPISLQPPAAGAAPKPLGRVEQFFGITPKRPDGSQRKRRRSRSRIVGALPDNRPRASA